MGSDGAIRRALALHERLLTLNATLTSSSDTYAEKTAAQTAFIAALSPLELTLLLSAAGFIPEEFPHDGVEEKCYARSMEVLVCHIFTRLGLHAALCAGRGGAADIAVVATNVSFVVDTKATRFSCPTFQTKSMKVTAMAEWKPVDGHAMLIGPPLCFPTRRSRTYREAVAANVTILTYPHLQALLIHRRHFSPAALLPLLTFARQEYDALGADPTGDHYNARRDRWFCHHTGITPAALERVTRDALMTGYAAAERKRAHYERAHQAVSAMSRDELEAAVRRGLDAERKVAMIERRKTRVLRAAAMLSAYN